MTSSSLNVHDAICNNALPSLNPNPPRTYASALAVFSSKALRTALSGRVPPGLRSIVCSLKAFRAEIFWPCKIDTKSPILASECQ